jgi:NADH dehydrogenase
MVAGTAFGGSGSAVGGLCLSGATGFIGTRVLARLAHDRQSNITLLVRDSRRLPEVVAALPGLRVVEGDVTAPEAWERALEPGQTVVHLAAATGRARWAELHRVNVGGTQALLRCGARIPGIRILYVSSIAACFPDRRWYPYAATKVMAEELVRRAGLPYAIIRPTLVLGPGSPVEAALRGLARLRLPVFPGSGAVLTQPVQVDDLAETIVETARAPGWEAVEGDLGGPRTLRLRELVEELASVAGRRPGPGIRIPLPLTPIRATLAFLEGLTGRRRSFGSGQLCAFANNSVALHPFEIPDGHTA